MQIEWIGTGSGLNPILGNTSFIVRGKGERIVLVDCGCTVPIALVKNNYMSQITDIIITHAHADHIAGLEGFGFMHYYALKNRDEKRPTLHVANKGFAHSLWENSLKGGMQKNQNDKNVSFDANLETFFKLSFGNEISIEGLPKIVLFETPHVQNLENYGLEFPEVNILYSGDTLAKPSKDFELIFQDCQFYKSIGDVHISYDDLLELDSKTRNKMWLVHLGGGWDKKDAIIDGFAGFVQPGQIFNFQI